MKIQGVVGLEIREYLGCCDGSDKWQHIRYAIGVEEEGLVRDYKTGEYYDYIPRTKKGLLAKYRDEILPGNNYAIESNFEVIDKTKSYSDKELDKIIRASEFLSDSYKKIEKQKPKQLRK